MKYKNKKINKGHLFQNDLHFEYSTNITTAIQAFKTSHQFL